MRNERGFEEHIYPNSRPATTQKPGPHFVWNCHDWGSLRVQRRKKLWLQGDVGIEARFSNGCELIGSGNSTISPDGEDV